jgi:uncharacterized membrane protein
VERAPVRALVALLICLAGPALAADFPALHAVSDVAADDMLNIRSRPDANAPVIGALAPDAQDVEVVRLSQDGRWALVNLAEQSGWAAVAYLTAQDSPPDAERPLNCSGTEPFWSLQTGGTMLLTQLDTPTAEYFITTRTTASGRSDRYALGGGGMEGLATALITRQICSDGMSDREFGFEIDLLIDTGEAQTYLTGCCALTP